MDSKQLHTQMEPADVEQKYRGDKAVKRGLVYERKDSHPATSQVWRTLDPAPLDEHCTPRRFILAIFCLLAIFALTGCFIFANSIGGNPLLHESIFISDNSHAKTNRLPLQTSGQADVNSEAVDSPVQAIATEPALGIGSSPLGCNERAAMLKVYMYDLSPEFHYGMLMEPPYPKGQIWPRNLSAMPPYPGGLYQQHSPEYWLTSDLLTSTFPDRESLCTAYRVDDWRFADVIFIPFFASLGYNRYTRAEMRATQGDRNRELQEKLVAFLKQQPAWQASGGIDHVLVIHHPNSMQMVRDRLGSVMFVVADFGRYTPEVANIGKDIVAPYKHVVSALPEDLTSFESRKTLLFFQGAIHRKEGGIIRQQLYELLKDEANVHFEAGNTTSAAIRSSTEGMQSSKFCLNLAGDTPSSNRLFDAIASHCIPVIISDEIELPFEDDLDYSKFCLFVKSEDALKSGFMINLLRGMSSEEWTQMWRRLQEVDHHFKYQHPTKPDDAVHMTWKAIARKVSKVRLLLNKQRRYRMSRLKLKASKGFINWTP